MPRIVAGLAGGRRLRAPKGGGTRPTSERVREALYSTLDALTDVRGARVLDLYAGSGALGLEALSRGAAHALLVDSAAAAVDAARANVEALGLPGAEVRRASAAALATGGPPAAPYDVVLADPPYDLPAADVAALLSALLRGGWLAGGAVVVVERPSREGEFPWPPGVTGVRGRRYGETALWYGRAE